MTKGEEINRRCKVVLENASADQVPTRGIQFYDLIGLTEPADPFHSWMDDGFKEPILTKEEYDSHKYWQRCKRRFWESIRHFKKDHQKQKRQRNGVSVYEFQGYDVDGEATIGCNISTNSPGKYNLEKFKKHMLGPWFDLIEPGMKDAPASYDLAVRDYKSRVARTISIKFKERPASGRMVA